MSALLSAVCLIGAPAASAEHSWSPDVHWNYTWDGYLRGISAVKFYGDRVATYDRRSDGYSVVTTAWQQDVGTEKCWATGGYGTHNACNYEFYEDQYITYRSCLGNYPTICWNTCVNSNRLNNP